MSQTAGGGVRLQRRAAARGTFHVLGLLRLFQATDGSNRRVFGVPGVHGCGEENSHVKLCVCLSVCVWVYVRGGEIVCEWM